MKKSFFDNNSYNSCQLPPHTPQEALAPNTTPTPPSNTPSMPSTRGSSPSGTSSVDQAGGGQQPPDPSMDVDPTNNAIDMCVCVFFTLNRSFYPSWMRITIKPRFKVRCVLRRSCDFPTYTMMLLFELHHPICMPLCLCST